MPSMCPWSAEETFALSTAFKRRTPCSARVVAAASGLDVRRLGEMPGKFVSLLLFIYSGHVYIYIYVEMNFIYS